MSSKASTMSISDMAALIGVKSILTIEEVALFTGFAKGTIYHMVEDLKIPHYKKSNRAYFKKDEIEAWMTESRVDTIDDIESQADKYITKKSLTHKK